MIICSKIYCKPPEKENVIETFSYFSTKTNAVGTQKNHLNKRQGWKILKFFTCPTSPYVLVNSILNIGNSQNFYSSYSIRHSPWRADEWIFQALRGFFWAAKTTTGRRQSKTLSTINERGSKIDRNSVFHWHLSPHWRQMAIESSVSSNFWFAFLDSIGVFDCCLPGVKTCCRSRYGNFSRVKLLISYPSI